METDMDMLVNEGDNYEEGTSDGRSGVSRSEGQRYRDTLLQGLRDHNIIYFFFTNIIVFIDFNYFNYFDDG